MEKEVSKEEQFQRDMKLQMVTSELSKIQLLIDNDSEIKKISNYRKEELKHRIRDKRRLRRLLTSVNKLSHVTEYMVSHEVREYVNLLYIQYKQEERNQLREIMVSEKPHFIDNYVTDTGNTSILELWGKEHIKSYMEIPEIKQIRSSYKDNVLIYPNNHEAYDKYKQRVYKQINNDFNLYVFFTTQANALGIGLYTPVKDFLKHREEINKYVNLGSNAFTELLSHLYLGEPLKHSYEELQEQQKQAIEKAKQKKEEEQQKKEEKVTEHIINSITPMEDFSELDYLDEFDKDINDSYNLFDDMEDSKDTEQNEDHDLEEEVENTEEVEEVYVSDTEEKSDEEDVLFPEENINNKSNVENNTSEKSQDTSDDSKLNEEVIFKDEEDDKPQIIIPKVEINTEIEDDTDNSLFKQEDELDEVNNCDTISLTDLDLSDEDMVNDDEIIDMFVPKFKNVSITNGKTNNINTEIKPSDLPTEEINLSENSNELVTLNKVEDNTKDINDVNNFESIFSNELNQDNSQDESEEVDIMGEKLMNAFVTIYTEIANNGGYSKYDKISYQAILSYVRLNAKLKYIESNEDSLFVKFSVSDDVYIASPFFLLCENPFKLYYDTTNLLTLNSKDVVVPSEFSIQDEIIYIVTELVMKKETLYNTIKNNVITSKAEHVLNLGKQHEQEFKGLGLEVSENLNRVELKFTNKTFESGFIYTGGCVINVTTNETIYNENSTKKSELKSIIRRNSKYINNLQEQLLEILI